MYLGSVSLLLQAVDALLQRVAGSLLLFQRRPQLLLQTMALGRQLAHLDLNAEPQTNTLIFVLKCWFIKLYILSEGITEKFCREVLDVLPWRFLAAVGLPPALLSETPAPSTGSSPAHTHTQTNLNAYTIQANTATHTNDAQHLQGLRHNHVHTWLHKTIYIHQAAHLNTHTQKQTCILASATSFLVFTSSCFILEVFSSPWSSWDFKASGETNTRHTHTGRKIEKGLR